MNKKNLDKLFQENLKDFRQMPDDKVWKSIENSLDQRKKTRRVVPIWWKLGGAAAILAIALMVFSPFGAEDLPEDSVTGVESPEAPDKKQEIDKNTDSLYQDQEERSVEGIVSTPDEDIPVNGVAEGGDQGPAAVEAGIVSSSVGEEKPESLNTSTVSEQEPTGVALRETEDRDAVDGDMFDKEISDEEVLATTQKGDNKNQTAEKEAGTEKSNELLTSPENRTSEEVVAAVSSEENEAETEEEAEKRSIFEEIEKQEEEALLAENEASKWSVGAVVAPVYFGAVGEGSPIHSNFVSNNKSGNVNLSYGLAVGYKLTEKLSLRSGLNKVDYGYDTNDISFSSSLVASTSTQITNINYTNTSRTLVVESNNLPESNPEFAANDIVAQSPSRNGTMVQEFGYLEVPMELNYALLDRKLNINLIGGISSLFLVDNTVVLESDGSSTEMGEANNLNDVNFSTNVGLGINYEFTNKVRIHLEPVFKYRLNTFSEVEGSFQPYTMGVYTGMSYKF